MVYENLRYRVIELDLVNGGLVVERKNEIYVILADEIAEV